MMNTLEYNRIFDIIKLSLWDEGRASADWDIYRELREHTVASLAAPKLGELSLSSDLYNYWVKSVIQQCYKYKKYRYFESILPITVPYVILKGSTVAQYYPHPEYRDVGDIDLMLQNEDFDAACAMLEQNGYLLQPGRSGRHKQFEKNGVLIEVHRFFSRQNDLTQASIIDNLIRDHITDSHILPDYINGLVLIEHINQHLETGIGLRQIIDWMMFVNTWVSDENWLSLEPVLRETGLEKIAIIITRLCEMYLGLPERYWAAEADEALCCRLMNYIMDSGNFGHKYSEEELRNPRIYPYLKNPFRLFQMLQRHGLVNWKKTQEFKILRPFAWLYQLASYGKKVIFRKNPIIKMKNEYQVGKERNDLLIALGAKQNAKGITMYKDGHFYTK